LIHSRKETASEITAFAKQWKNYASLVIIPTKYHNTPTQQFRDMNISLVIWANHSLRASINAMKKVCQKIFLEESLSQIEKKISSIEEIFDLTKQLELDEQDKFFRN